MFQSLRVTSTLMQAVNGWFTHPAMLYSSPPPAPPSPKTCWCPALPLSLSLSSRSRLASYRVTSTMNVKCSNKWRNRNENCYFLGEIVYSIFIMYFNCAQVKIRKRNEGTAGPDQSHSGVKQEELFYQEAAASSVPFPCLLISLKYTLGQSLPCLSHLTLSEPAGVRDGVQVHQ